MKKHPLLIPVMVSVSLLLLVHRMSAQTPIEEKIGETTYHSVEQSMGFYDNEVLLDYVKGIGRKLEAQLPDNPYEFKYFLVDTPEPNAFATAGGYVFVTRGILPILDSELALSAPCSPVGEKRWFHGCSMCKTRTRCLRDSTL